MSDMERWARHRTQYRKRPIQDVPEWPDLCEPPTTTDAELAELSPEQRDELAAILRQQRDDLQGEIDRIGEYREDEWGMFDADRVEVLRCEYREALMERWRDGTDALLAKLG